MIKGIIFDMDGTLIDSIPMHYKTWYDLGQEYGYEMSRELFDELNGRSTLEICTELKKRFGLSSDIDEIMRRKQQISGQALADGVPLFDGVRETLLLLKRLGYRISVGSSSPREHVLAALGPNLDLEFDAIVGGDEVERSKPEPDIFLKCCELMNLQPTDCMVVEDSLSGIEAAKKGGMCPVAVTNTTSGEKFDVRVIKSFRELNTEFISGCQ